MSAEEIGELEILVNKLKFRAGQKASDLHDLIEDRLMTDFEDIPSFAEIAYLACKEKPRVNGSQTEPGEWLNQIVFQQNSRNPNDF